MLTNPREEFRGQSRSTNSSIPYVRYSFLLRNSNAPILRYSTSKNVVTLKPGHRSLKVIESGTIRKIVYCFLLVFFSNIAPKTHRFWDIRLQNCCDLVTRVRGPSRSLKMSPCNRVHMTSYWRSIVTMAVSRVVSGIFNVRK